MQPLFFKTSEGEILISQQTDENTGKNYISGSFFGQLITGGQSVGKFIKPAMKRYAEINNIIIGKAKHQIYGIYSADIINTLI